MGRLRDVPEEGLQAEEVSLGVGGAANVGLSTWLPLLCLELGRLAARPPRGCVTERPPRPRPRTPSPRVLARRRRPSLLFDGVECVDVNLLALVRARERVGEEGCEVRACKRGVRFCERWHSICANRWREDSRGIFETRKLTTVINEWRRQLKRACYTSQGQKTKLHHKPKSRRLFCLHKSRA